MALIIEDGSAKPNASSYATVAELRGYAAARGATVPGSDGDCEMLLVKAWDSLLGRDYVGCRRTHDQAGDWPRSGANVEDWPVPEDEIPRQLVQAQCALAIEAQTTELLPTEPISTRGVVTSETVGPISRTYANNGKVLRVPAVAKADVLLRTLLRRSGLFAVRT